MRRALFIAICLGAVPGCGAFHDIELYPLNGPSGDGGACPYTPDMTVVPAAKCAAAKGLGGDTLLCVDMAQVSSVDALRAMNWIVAKDSMNNECWEIMSGTLQVKNFSNFTDDCLFKLPALIASSHVTFTLSVVQTVTVNKMKQSASIYLGAAQDTQQLVSSTGTNPKQRSIYEVATVALPNGGSGMYQPLFKLASGGIQAGSLYQGWQIESVAVMGNAQ